MAQNRSTAVMQRRVEPHDSLDDFPTPPWATRAALEFLEREGFDLSGAVREPAANRGHMVRPLAERFGRVYASDVHDYGVGFVQADYLFGPAPAVVDWTFTNPPFKLAEAFVARMRETSRIGCAVIVRTAFLEGVGRFERLFAEATPSFVLPFAERVVMHKGRLAPKGSTATAYAWLIWITGPAAPRRSVLDIIPPCRSRLELPGDYPDEGIGLAAFDAARVSGVLQ